jgi:uncharacterized protein (DUF983 family)
MPKDEVVANQPTFGKMLRRALVRSCPWCGDHRAWFPKGLRGWFGRLPRCRHCGLRWDRNTNGHELGALVINTIMIMGLLITAMVVGIVLTAPDIAVVPLVVGLGIAAIVGPVISYPFGYTIWMAIDLAARKPDEAELADAAAALAAPVPTPQVPAA